MRQHEGEEDTGVRTAGREKGEQKGERQSKTRKDREKTVLQAVNSLNALLLLVNYAKKKRGSRTYRELKWASKMNKE